MHGLGPFIKCCLCHSPSMDKYHKILMKAKLTLNYLTIDFSCLIKKKKKIRKTVESTWFLTFDIKLWLYQGTVRNEGALQSIKE